MRKSLSVANSNREESISEVFRRQFHIALAHDGSTQKDIAAQINMSVPAFSHAINGGRISLQFAYKVAKALDLSMDWLCGLEEE